jgi:hypothetical protein
MKRRRFGLGRVIALTCIVASATPALGQVPIGAAEFRIVSGGEVEKAMGPARKAPFEAMFSNEIAAKAERHFGFVDWAAGDRAAHPFALTIRLIEVPAGNCLPDTKLQLAVVLGTLTIDGKAVDLYDGCHPAPPFAASELTKFEEDVRSRLDLLLDEPGRETVLENLARVSIASTLMLDHAQMQVLLPLRLEDLKASDESQLTARFTASGALGVLRLRPLGAIANSILCEVSAYEVAPPFGIITNERLFWHPSFERVFPADNMPAINVFMTSYDADPFPGLTVGNGIVQRLQ